ncbi:hypothetical protein BEK98_40050 [Streptomyces diastatochromogenes]|uniref:Uncharacterized protein n=1 Tax=Streptomyces diastatochromogenes TaxID=42236 RepID=A0A233S036_STRDA|nr:hypothetical protein BEK98_40050 [Streptomyces diastatochromogenes]
MTREPATRSMSGQAVSTCLTFTLLRASAFRLAGFPRVIGSFWSVNDRSDQVSCLTVSQVGPAERSDGACFSGVCRVT